MEYDIAVIGAGPGGYVAAIRAAQLGFKTICIDKRETLGGTCLNVGCIPSKALLYSTELYHLIKQEGVLHGISAKEVAIDFQQLMTRKEQVVKSLVDGIAGLFQKNKVTFLRGEARFLSPQELEINQGEKKEQVQARYFIIATGSEPVDLPFLPFDEEKIVSSTGALSLKEIPRRLAVIGGGVIGVELASVYRRLGAEVSVIEMLDRICPAMDGTISKALLQVLKKQGIQFFLSSRLTKGEKREKSIILSFEQEGGQHQLESDIVLVAVGRRPYTQGLALEKTGLATTAKGFISVDGMFRTTQPHIFAIGDAIEGAMLAHRASEEGIALVEWLAGHHSTIQYLTIPNVIYTSPEAAAVGLTEEEANEKGLEALVGQYPFKANSRARCSHEIEGLVKIVADKKTKKLVGMHILGSQASELIQQGMFALIKRMTLEEIGEAPCSHPTLSEAIKEAALQALGRPIHL